MSRLRAPDGTPLSVFTDGEVVVTMEDGTEVVESFENMGQEMEIDLSDFRLAGCGGIDSVILRQTDAKVAKSREEVEQHG